MQWIIRDPAYRVAATGDTETAAWRAAEEHTNHEKHDLKRCGYWAEPGMSDRHFGWVAILVSVPGVAAIAWGIWTVLS